MMGTEDQHNEAMAKIDEAVNALRAAQVPEFRVSPDDPLYAVYKDAYARVCQLRGQEALLYSADVLGTVLEPMLKMAKEGSIVHGYTQEVIGAVTQLRTEVYKIADAATAPTTATPEEEEPTKKKIKHRVSNQKTTGTGCKRLRLHAETCVIGKARVVIYEESDAGRVWTIDDVHEAITAEWPDAGVSRDSVVSVLGTMYKADELWRVRKGRGSTYTKHWINTDGMHGLTYFIEGLFTEETPTWTRDDVVRRLVHDHGHKAEKVKTTCDTALRSMTTKELAVRVGKTYTRIGTEAPVQAIVLAIMAGLPEPGAPFRIGALQKIMENETYRGSKLGYNQIRDSLRALISKGTVTLITDGTYQRV